MLIPCKGYPPGNDQEKNLFKGALGKGYCRVRGFPLKMIWQQWISSSLEKSLNSLEGSLGKMRFHVWI